MREPSPDVLDHSSHWRTVYAAAAWKEGFQSVVMSGRGVAPAMKRMLVVHGVPESAIVVEDASSSTREDAFLTAALLRGRTGRKILLTSDYHMYRAKRCFAATHLDISPRPFPDALKRFNDPLQRWPVFCDLLLESVKIAAYRWRGWI